MMQNFEMGNQEELQNRFLIKKIGKKRTNTGNEDQLLLTQRHPKVIKVRQNGKGDFRTIKDAINSIPYGNTRRTILRIGRGVFKEKVTVNMSKPYVTLYGNPLHMPTITYNSNASQYGTFDSATVAVESDYFVAANIIFENYAPKPVPGQEGSQAVAMRISGDKAAFYNCKFYGHQDTLCDEKGMHFYKDCYIRGTIDFIFGDGKSIYLNCTIESIADRETAITAQGRSSKSEQTGFVFINGSIIGTGNAYLSRAWRAYSRVVFAYTYMDRLINPKGWDSKGTLPHRGSVYYGEYKCKGPGAVTNHRAKCAKMLTDEQAKPFLSMDFIEASAWLLPLPKFRNSTRKLIE